MAAVKRPTRVVLILTALILLGIGVAAYFVNLPLAWIVAGEAVAMLALAWRVSQSKQSQPVAPSEPEAGSKR
ncbi:MAG: hypothetical protein ACT4P6_06515 [Gemmatimonadaceae bacterium]